MSESKLELERGMNGRTPALPTRADEAYMDFVSDARNILMHQQWGRLVTRGNAVLAEAEKDAGKKPNSLEALREVLGESSEVAAFLRAKRTLQEFTWRRPLDSFAAKQEDFLKAFDESDNQGPGTVTWDPKFPMPDYATVDIHIQPGGYTAHPLAGLVYDHGTRVFFDGAADSDVMHGKLAEKASVPADEKVERILDLGCSIGQLTCALKQRFADAEVWGIDIGAPMVRYAHWRAAQQGIEVNFAQMASEKLNYPDDHFDLVTAHILFHEIPIEVIRETLKETFRVLRPGGTFVMWDFSSATDADPSYGSFMGQMDAIDNGEPYALGFVRCGVENIMEQIGFKLRSRDPKDLFNDGRVGDKPQ